MVTSTAVQTQATPDGDIELHHIEQSAQPLPPLHPASQEPDISRKVIAKIVVAGFSFFFAGANDGSLGALTPYILRTYHVGTEYVALM